MQAGAYVCGRSMKLPVVAVVLLAALVVAADTFLFPELQSRQTTNVMNRIFRKHQHHNRAANQVRVIADHSDILCQCQCQSNIYIAPIIEGRI